MRPLGFIYSAYAESKAQRGMWVRKVLKVRRETKVLRVRKG
jgi:hypothetical protein